MPPKPKIKGKIKGKPKKQIKLTKEQQQIIVLIGIVTVAAFVGTYLLMLGPDLAVLKKNKNELGSLESEIQEKKRISYTLPGMEKEIESISADIEGFRNNLVTNAEYEFFRDTVRDMGMEYEVRVVSDQTTTSYGEKKTVFKENTQYTEKMMTLKLMTSYHDFGGFLNRIENTSPFRKVVYFSVDKKGRNNRGGNKSNKLFVQMHVLSLLAENQE